MAERTEIVNHLIPLSNSLAYVLESGEIRRGNETVAQLEARTRVVFNALVEHPNLAVSFFEIIKADEEMRRDADDCFYEREKIGAAVGRTRRVLGLLEEGLDKRVETVRGYGYRWKDQNDKTTT